jgi:hypothetical protein
VQFIQYLDATGINSGYMNWGSDTIVTNFLIMPDNKVTYYVGPDPSTVFYRGNASNLPSSVDLNNISVTHTNGAAINIGGTFTSQGISMTNLPTFTPSGTFQGTYTNGAYVWANPSRPYDGGQSFSSSSIDNRQFWSWDAAMSVYGDSQTYTNEDGIEMMMGWDKSGRPALLFSSPEGSTNGFSFSLINTNDDSFNGPWTQAHGIRARRGQTNSATNGMIWTGTSPYGAVWPAGDLAVLQTNVSLPLWADGLGTNGIPLASGMGGGGGGGGGVGGGGFSIGDFVAPEPLYRDLVFTNGEFRASHDLD